MGCMGAEKPRYLGVFSFFEAVPEPRVERTRLHPLVNVLIIAMLAMICVGEGWEDMEEFGLAKEAWLGTFLNLRHGIPSADTFRRVLSAVNPKAFNACSSAAPLEHPRPNALRDLVEGLSADLDQRLR